MESFIDILKACFGVGEPILTKDILDTFPDLSRSTVFYRISSAVKSGTLIQYVRGVYYVPKVIELFNQEEVLPIDPDKVIECKYLKTGDNICGFISGSSLQNKYGISNQVPGALEITTNLETNRSRKILAFGGYKEIILRRPKITVTNDNVSTLEAIDIIANVETNSLDKDELNAYKDFVSSVPKRQLLNCIMSYSKNTINKYLKGVASGLISA